MSGPGGPRSARLARQAAIEDEIGDVGCRRGEVAFIEPLSAEHGADLDLEIGIVLGGRPELEDKMLGIDGPELAALEPLPDHLRLLLDALAQVGRQVGFKERRAMQDLVGKALRGIRAGARPVEFPRDVIGDRLGGLALRRKAVELVEPQLQDIGQHGAVELGLGTKVIVQVGLGQTRLRRDGGRGGAREATFGEHRFRLLQEALFVTFANPAATVSIDLAGSRRGHGGSMLQDRAQSLQPNLTIWSDSRYRAEAPEGRTWTASRHGASQQSNSSRTSRTSTSRSIASAPWSRPAAAISASTRPAWKPARPASTSRASSARSRPTM